MSRRSDPVATRVRATLRAKADQVTARPGPFDADRPVTLAAEAVPVPVERVPRSSGRRLALAAVAAVAVLGVAAVVALRRGSDDGGTTSTAASTTTSTAAATSTAPPPPDGALAPSWVPDDLTLWTTGWLTMPAGTGRDDHEQLFGRDGGTGAGAVHVWIQSSDAGIPVGTNPTTVRGVQADLMPAKEFPDTTSALHWDEGGVAVTAEFVGIGLAETVAFLDGLTWRSADRVEGFAPPGGGDLTLLGETSPVPAGSTVLTAQFRYLDDDGLSRMPGEGRQLEVRTTTATGGGITPNYLQTWFHADRDEDGVLESYDPRYGSLQRDWPDGRSLWVDANSTAVDRSELARVADSVAAVSAVELGDLRDGVRDRLGASQLVAAADLDGGRLEVHARGPAAVLCLQPAGGALVCPADLYASGGPDAVATGFVVGDTWYAAAAATGAYPEITEPVDIVTGTGGTPIPDAATATADGWNFRLVAVPAGIDSVSVKYGTQGVGLQRSFAEQ